MTNIKQYFLFTLCSLTMLSGCLIVKEKDEIVTKKSDIQNIPTAPKPEVKMSNKMVRTATGDMMALLPEGWFFVEADGNLSSEIFAIAVNPEYTLSAVFLRLKKDETSKEIVEKEGVIGLSRIAFRKHEERSTGGLKLLDKYQTIDIGLQKFGSFSFVKTKDNSFGNSAVFISSMGEYYEFSLITMNINQNLQPTRPELEKIYRSILATLKY